MNLIFAIILIIFHHFIYKHELVKIVEDEQANIAHTRKMIKWLQVRKTNN